VEELLSPRNNSLSFLMPQLARDRLQVAQLLYYAQMSETCHC
jgi:hypothetical protein